MQAMSQVSHVYLISSVFRKENTDSCAGHTWIQRGLDLRERGCSVGLQLWYPCHGVLQSSSTSALAQALIAKSTITRAMFSVKLFK